jgi:hypothetical protein
MTSRVESLMRSSKLFWGGAGPGLVLSGVLPIVLGRWRRSGDKGGSVY